MKFRKLASNTQKQNWFPTPKRTLGSRIVRLRTEYQLKLFEKFLVLNYETRF